jgi:hypothetical protein
MAPRPEAGGGLVWLTAENALGRVEAAGRVVHDLHPGARSNVKTSERAEREGFEPSDGFEPVNSLAVSPIRPLSHLSSISDLLFCLQGSGP